MRYTDIAIIGGSLAGSTAAATLGRAGIPAVLIDPHRSYPPGFRVEKLSGRAQLERFSRTGFAESVLRRATFTGENKIRPVDLAVNSGCRQAGIVLVGDAFATSCPVAGTGTAKVHRRRAANIHISAWLATDGMDAGKIATFYDDPVKQACDAWSSAKAFDFREVSIATSPHWTAQRWARFTAWGAQGWLQRLGRKFHLESSFLGHSSSSSSSSSSLSSSSS